MNQGAQHGSAKGDPVDCDAVVVGAGFAGLYMVYKLRELGLRVRAFEKGGGVGGTWYWNSYPGARVDIESFEYSYSFSAELEHEWRWSERYSTQPELLNYANHVADRFNLRQDIQFDTAVTRAIFDEGAGCWNVTTDRGETVKARYCIMATGCLSVPKDIDIPGIERFAGAVYRTSNWPKQGVDFTGQRVAVIGTGSSGIQVVPEIARQAAHLTVFQRTANFSLPARNAPTDEERLRAWLDNREENRRQQRNLTMGAFVFEPAPRSVHDVSDEEREAIFEEGWQHGGFRLSGMFNDLLIDKSANDKACEFIRGKISSIVEDPEVAERLTPRDHPFATKRPCVDSGYFATFNRDNVDLVSLRETPLETVTASGIKVSGAEYAVDSIVLAIGFDAMTGALNAMDIRGRAGVSLKDLWADGPRTYLGLAIAGLPNFFLVTGPGSPSVLTNVMVAIEQHVEWIAGCIEYMRDQGLGAIEARADAQEDWVDHVNEVADRTLYPQADSWYLGANVPGKKRVFMPYIGGWRAYRDRCNEIAAAGYTGFSLALTPSALPEREAAT